MNVKLVGLEVDMETRSKMPGACYCLLIGLLVAYCGGSTPRTNATMTDATNAPDVTTYHYNNARDGLNAQETILTPDNVNPNPVWHDWLRSC